MKSLTYTRVDGKLVPAFSESFSFSTKAARDFFASRQKNVLDVSKWQIKKGKHGNKRWVYYCSVYTKRED